MFLTGEWRGTGGGDRQEMMRTLAAVRLWLEFGDRLWAVRELCGCWGGSGRPPILSHTTGWSWDLGQLPAPVLLFQSGCS